MTKKEEVVDLKPKAEKISEEQLKQVQETVNKILQNACTIFFFNNLL